MCQKEIKDEVSKIKKIGWWAMCATTHERNHVADCIVCVLDWTVVEEIGQREIKDEISRIKEIPRRFMSRSNHEWKRKEHGLLFHCEVVQ